MTANKFHSTSVVIEDLGILIRGKSGSGKSDSSITSYRFRRNTGIR